MTGDNTYTPGSETKKIGIDALRDASKALKKAENAFGTASKIANDEDRSHLDALTEAVRVLRADVERVLQLTTP